MTPPASASDPIPPGPHRHYGLDWLRIGAFGLLIVYHIGMVFAPWRWVIKTPHVVPALIPPMALVTPWRLPLLFAVSGYASAMLWRRSPSPRAFVARRNARLLVPLAFAMAVIVPAEMWVRVLEAGYPHGYPYFWAIDYWRVGRFWGQRFPSWEHLWFVAYLWAYTLVIAGVLAAGGGRAIHAADAVAAWLGQGRRLLWAPVAVWTPIKLVLLFTVPEEPGLTTDWGGHAWYLPLFAFGFLLGARGELWPAVLRCLRPALLVSAIGGAIVLVVELRYPGTTVPPHGWMALDRAARIAMGWSMTLGLFALAERHANRDHRWRATLGEAVFPFYLIHHPAIVLIAWFTLPLGLGAGAEFAVLLAGTALACVAFYRIGRAMRWLRPLIGLRPLPPRPSR